MAGGYANPAKLGRNLTLQDRVNATQADQPATSHRAAEVWIMPDYSSQPLRGHVEAWTQDGQDWIATIRIQPTGRHDQ